MIEVIGFCLLALALVTVGVFCLFDFHKRRKVLDLICGISSILAGLLLLSATIYFYLSLGMLFT